MANLSIACACREVAAVLADVGPTQGDHVVCHCTDCQNFARYLGAADRILQQHGGTALYQCRCARLRLTKGTDKLACLHLTDKPTLRWYASCCRTPLFNTYANGRIPYITTLVANCRPEEVTAAIGPVVGHLQLKQAHSDAPPMAMRTLMRRFLGRMLRDVISGDRRRNALFDPVTLAPISRPYRLSGADRRALA